MIIREFKDTLEVSEDIFRKYNMGLMAYFDIETTGFDKEKDRIILISLGWYSNDDKFTLKQYFAESLSEEKELLIEFLKDLSKLNKWCSYNGKAFDEPFIRKKIEKNNINMPLPEEHIDLYRIVRPYYRQLGMSRCNLKTVEKYIGIDREDTIDGGMSIELYYDYLETKDENLKKIIMLHNYEDVLNLPKIFKIVHEIDTNIKIKRENSITDKQKKFLNVLLKKNNVKLNTDIKKVSRKAASRVIDSLLKGNKDSKELIDLIKNSY